MARAGSHFLSLSLSSCCRSESTVILVQMIKLTTRTSYKSASVLMNQADHGAKNNCARNWKALPRHLPLRQGNLPNLQMHLDSAVVDRARSNHNGQAFEWLCCSYSHGCSSDRSFHVFASFLLLLLLLILHLLLLALLLLPLLPLPPPRLLLLLLLLLPRIRIRIRIRIQPQLILLLLLLLLAFPPPPAPVRRLSRSMFIFHVLIDLPTCVVLEAAEPFRS